MLLKRCKAAGLKVTAFYDSNPKLWGTRIEGVRVYSPQDLEALREGTQVIAASIIHEQEILGALERFKGLRILPLSLLAFFHPVLFDLRSYRQRFETIFSQRKAVEKTASIWADPASRKLFQHMIEYRALCHYGCDPKMLYSDGIQYFEKGLISLGNAEVFVDGGSFNGDTIEVFHDLVRSYGELHGFEPDPRNYRQLKINASRLRKKGKGLITPVNCGLHRKKGTLRFYALSSSTSLLAEEQDFGIFQGQSQDEVKRHVVEVPVTSIDEYFADKTPPTFIKLDIEGAEIEALKGASKTIRKYRPKLAICVYHKPDDLWKIPLLIKSINPDYKLHLRHYSLEICETICYAF
jgi:FkbM family methyltransferase